ncbi:MAG TPA: nucleotidyltransferase family protein [Candidatus Polarisedimenticolia bacterium]|nr:nucleotidyltransferase family protein [Candidatus Polarisedimenticolia bacterium]
MPEPALNMRGQTNKSHPPILERDLLLRAVTSAGSEAVAAYKAWRATVDFKGPIDPETAALLPQLYQALLKLGLDDPLMGIFAGVSRRAWYENQILLASVERSLDSLAREQVDCCLVGDLPLVLTHYRSLHSRQIGQIDIVVSPGHAPRAARLLSTSGWVAQSPLAAEEVAYNHIKRFTGPAARVLNLHWHFIGSASSAAADEFFWAARQRFVVHGAEAWRLSPTAMLLHSLLGDTPMLAAMPALWIADERALIAGAGHEIDWAQIADFATRQKLGSRLRRKLQLLGRFGVAVPELAANGSPDGRASLADAIDGVILRHRTQRREYTPIGKWGVFADYLRSERRTGFLRGVVEFPHFVRHRWGLRGRREVLPVAARRVWRAAGFTWPRPTER